MTLQTDAPDDALDPAVADYLLGVLLSALPPAADEAADSARRDAVRIAFQSMQPRNPKEAMLAAEAIGAHHVIMDCYRLALSPETEPAAAARARNNAATLSRGRRAALRALEHHEAPPAATRRPAAPVPRKPDAVKRIAAPAAVEPAPEQPPAHPPRYRPRDRFGNPIELWRWEDMSMAQRRAVYADPGQVAVLEEALAEEAGAIAAQAAADAGDPEAVAADAGSDPRFTPPSAAPC
jgi:hypothetical protein